jgi:hypothetical protein
MHYRETTVSLKAKEMVRELDCLAPDLPKEETMECAPRLRARLNWVREESREITFIAR